MTQVYAMDDVSFGKDRVTISQRSRNLPTSVIAQMAREAFGIRLVRRRIGGEDRVFEDRTVILPETQPTPRAGNSSED